MRRLLLIPLGLVALLLGAMAWSGEGVETKADLSYINRGDVNTLDLNRMSWAQDIRLAYALWEGLYTLHPETLAPIPGAAEQIDISDDGREYTFHLRADGRWTNGDVVSAHDFVFGWRRMLENPDEYSSLFHCIEGAKDYQAWYVDWRRLKQEEWAAMPAPQREAEKDQRAVKVRQEADERFKAVGVEVIDLQTLKVRLANPTAYFPSLTAFPAFFPQHRPSMEPFGEVELATGHVTYNEAYTRAGRLVTNGPYRLAEWKFRQKVRVVASDYYWNRDAVKLRIIDQIACEDPLAMYLMYRSGRVDWLMQVDANVAKALLERKDPDLHVFPGFGTYFYSINCQDKLASGADNPFRDARVRQAFAMSIDRQPVVTTITGTGEAPATTYIPPGIFRGYTSPGGLEPDIPKARELLAEAGYPGGKGLPRITLIYNTGSNHGEIAQVFRRQWLDELGVDVELQGIELASFRERLNKKDYMIARASWIGDYNDPTTFLDKYRSDSHGNDAGWVNKDYDALLDQAIVETDPAKRMSLLAQAENMLNRDAPIIPIYGYTNAFLIRPTLKGVPLHAQGLFVYHSLSNGGR